MVLNTCTWLSCVQRLSEDIEGRRAQVEKSLTFLTTLTTHLPIVNPSSINLCKDHLQKRWKDVYEEVDRRRDLASSGKEHLSLYLEQGGTFSVWLKGAEAQLAGLTPELNSKERLLSQIQEFEVTGAPRGVLRGPLRGVLRGPLRGVLWGPLRGVLWGPLRGVLWGPLRGVLWGPLRGVLWGPLRCVLWGPCCGGHSEVC